MRRLKIRRHENLRFSENPAKEVGRKFEGNSRSPSQSAPPVSIYSFQNGSMVLFFHFSTFATVIIA